LRKLAFAERVSPVMLNSMMARERLTARMSASASSNSDEPDCERDERGAVDDWRVDLTSATAVFFGFCGSEGRAVLRFVVEVEAGRAMSLGMRGSPGIDCAQVVDFG
jgi:hypothetical protein